jgi:cation:H+ antiporter
MDLLWGFGWLALGLVLLAGGADLLVRGSVGLARLMRITPAVIGLTIVAVGTSLPEFVVSLVAVLQGRPDVATGNVVGSNIFNIAVILGLCALVTPLRVHGSALKIEWPFMFTASFVALLLARDGSFDRLEGAVLVLSLVLFTAYMIRLARTEVRGRELDEFEAEVEALSGAGRWRSALRDGLWVGAGIAALAGGAPLLVRGAVIVAEWAGLSQRVIGLTIIAAGTSLPEVATSLAASYRKQAEIALANVIGSNIFNVLGVIGGVALIRPVPVSAGILRSDMWWMLGFSLVLLPIMRTGMRVARAEGMLLLLGYVIYLYFLI